MELCDPDAALALRRLVSAPRSAPGPRSRRRAGDAAELGPEAPAAVGAMRALAIVLTEGGDYARAEPLFLRALAVDEKNEKDPESEQIATTLSNLASLYEHQGKYGKAQPLYERALAIF